MTKQPTYRELRDKLDNLMSKLQDPETDIDEAITLYEQATKVVAELDAYLKTAELKIKKVTSK